MKTRYAIIALAVIILILTPINVSAPMTPYHATIPNPVPIARTLPSLNLTLLSATVNGCFQSPRINATWLGSGFYLINPTSFSLIINTRNAIYANTTDLIYPNNLPSQWILLHNVPITIELTFVSCTAIAFENLWFTDGQFTFKLA